MTFSIPQRAGLNPAADTNTVLFTSTNYTSALVTIVNQSTASGTYRVWHTRGSTTTDDTMLKGSDFKLLGNDDRTIGPMFLRNADSIVVRANSTSMAFTMEALSTG